MDEEEEEEEEEEKEDTDGDGTGRSRRSCRSEVRTVASRTVNTQWSHGTPGETGDRAH